MGKMDIDATPVVVGGETFEISPRSVQGPLVEITSCVGLGLFAGLSLLLRKVHEEGLWSWFLGAVSLAAITKKAWAKRAEAMVIPPLMDQVDHYFQPARWELLKGIKGQVLDLGCGSGPYLRYYLDSHARGAGVSKVVMLEPNTKMQPTLQRNMEEAKRTAPGLELEATSCFIEDLPGQEVFDCVVFGNVLCEVPDQEEIFRHVDRLLKPGGRVYFSEHTLTSSATLRWLQHLASPFWLCHCNRDSISKLRQQHWVKELHSWKFGLCFPVNRWELGLAVKA